MSIVAVDSACVFPNLSSEVVLCSCCHRYSRNGKELTSVSKVIRDTWPLKPDFSKADPETLEKAKQRGILVDAFLTQYIRGQNEFIPAGTREDIIDEGKELYRKLKAWWGDTWPSTQAQVILANDEMAGTCDIMSHRKGILDLKCSYDIEASYRLQLGLYALLAFEQYGQMPPALGIIHVTKRFAQPKLIELNVQECYQDALTVRDMWRLVRRLS